MWIPKYRKEKLFLGYAVTLARCPTPLPQQKGCKVLKGRLRPDHAHILASIPSKLSMASVVWFIKGKSVIYLLTIFSVGVEISLEKVFGRVALYFTVGLNKS